MAVGLRIGFRQLPRTASGRVLHYPRHFDFGCLGRLRWALTGRVVTMVMWQVCMGRVRSLATGGWYEFQSDDQPYDVAPGFAAAWKKARGLP